MKTPSDGSLSGRHGTGCQYVEVLGHARLQMPCGALRQFDASVLRHRDTGAKGRKQDAACRSYENLHGGLGDNMIEQNPL